MGMSEGGRGMGGEKERDIVWKCLKMSCKGWWGSWYRFLERGIVMCVF